MPRRVRSRSPVQVPSARVSVTIASSREWSSFQAAILTTELGLSQSRACAGTLSFAVRSASAADLRYGYPHHDEGLSDLQAGRFPPYRQATPESGRATAET